MKLEGDGKLLRIFVGESDRWEGRPLYEAIVRKVREEGLAGATVIRGIEGFGAHSRIHTARILRLSEDLPVVIEVVDRAERIDAVLSLLEPERHLGRPDLARGGSHHVGNVRADRRIGPRHPLQLARGQGRRPGSRPSTTSEVRRGP